MASTGTFYLTRHHLARSGHNKQKVLSQCIRQISGHISGEDGNGTLLYRDRYRNRLKSNAKLMSSLSPSDSNDISTRMKGRDGGMKRGIRTEGSQESNVISCARIFSSLAAKEFTSSSSSNYNDDMINSQIKPNSKVTASADEIISIEELQILAARKPIPLSLTDMFRYASAHPSQRLINAQFLHRELPTRIAQRTIDLLTLPHGLSKTRQVRNIAHKYLKYLHQLKVSPMPKNSEDEKEFTKMLASFVLDRTSIPMAIAAAVSSLKDKRREALDDRRLQEMEEALYRFFTSRVGLRFLTEHHILSQRTSNAEALRTRQGIVGDFDFLGCIQKDCDPILEVKKVVESVRRQCEECFGVAPQIEIIDCTREKNKDNTFTYVPHHLQYMLAELLKNSCRATVKRHLMGVNVQASTIHTSLSSHSSSDAAEADQEEENTLPSIKVVVVKGAEDVTIKIADRGGGVPRSEMDKIWTFAHSTLDYAQKAKESSQFATDDFTGGKIRGFGLPLARIYARYFGGELTLKSMEGYGLDAYLYLPVLGVACENLPSEVNLSPGNLDSNVTLEDINFLDSKSRGSSKKNGAFPAAMSNETLEKLNQKAL